VLTVVVFVAAWQEKLTRKVVQHFAKKKFTDVNNRWRDQFLYVQMRVQASEVVVIDESGVDGHDVRLFDIPLRLLTPLLVPQMQRRLGLGYSGDCVQQPGVVKGKTPRTSFICALDVDGMLPCTFALKGGLAGCVLVSLMCGSRLTRVSRVSRYV